MTSRRNLAIYATHGAGAYFGERVSMTEHALRALLRTAAAARAAGGPRAVDDIDTCWRQSPTHATGPRTRSTRQSAARWLAQRFPPRSANRSPVHVRAKRYLCATDGSTCETQCRLVHTEAAGWPMPAAEVAQSRAQRYFTKRCACGAGTMRQVAGLKTPQLAGIRPGSPLGAARGADSAHDRQRVRCLSAEAPSCGRTCESARRRFHSSIRAGAPVVLQQQCGQVAQRHDATPPGSTVATRRPAALKRGKIRLARTANASSPSRRESER